LISLCFGWGNAVSMGGMFLPFRRGVKQFSASVAGAHPATAA
jgi:hypothetical protein